LDAWLMVADALVMNTFAHSTRRSGRQIASTSDTNGNPVSGLVRRLATWWADDPMTATFSVERERDERLLRRPGAR
jgi:hypothetical protein